MDFQSVREQFLLTYTVDAKYYFQYPFQKWWFLDPIMNPLQWFCKTVGEQYFPPHRADQIHNRFCALMIELESKWNPEIVLSMSLDQLTKQIGYSKPKADYIYNIASFFTDHNMDDLSRMDTKALMKLLTSIKGVGVWTAKFWIISQLHRRDTFFEDRMDRLGLQRIAGLDKMPTIVQAQKIAKKRWGKFDYFGSMVCHNIGGIIHHRKEDIYFKN